MSVVTQQLYCNFKEIKEGEIIPSTQLCGPAWKIGYT